MRDFIPYSMCRFSERPKPNARLVNRRDRAKEKRHRFFSINEGVNSRPIWRRVRGGALISQQKERRAGFDLRPSSQLGTFNRLLEYYSTGVYAVRHRGGSFRCYTRPTLEAPVTLTKVTSRAETTSAVSAPALEPGLVRPSIV